MKIQPKRLDFFYDVVSPYSWLAFEVLNRYVPRWNIDFHLRPSFLGGIMNLSGNQPPGIIYAKLVYLETDLRRVSKFYQVPLKKPADAAERMFVLGSLNTMRYITAVQDIQPNYVTELSREFWMRCWNRDQGIHKESNFIEASKAIGMEQRCIDDALAKIKTTEIKEKLKATTQEAFDHGAFGTPTIIAHVNGRKEMFFGSDRFEILADLLGEKWEGPVPNDNPASDNVPHQSKL